MLTVQCGLNMAVALRQAEIAQISPVVRSAGRAWLFSGGAETKTI
jgi:hypothetical protein